MQGRDPFYSAWPSSFIDRNDDDKSFEESLKYLIDGAEVSHSPPTLRIESSTLAGIMLATKDDWREASRIAELAVNLLPTVAPRQLSQHDQQHLLSTTSVIATMAASFALEAEKAPLHAVQLLELGRGIITSLRSRLWSDVTELNLYDSGAEGDPLGSKPKRNDRHQASFDLDDTIGQIRLLPGFEKFLHPPPVEDVEERVKMLMPIRSNSKLTQQAEADMSSILGWLWDVAVCQILDVLGFPKPPMDDEWPRVWWIAVGELSSFPLHDAGRHTSSSTDSVIDRVVSSYSPSVRALLHARRQSRKASDSMHDQALLVSMATTA
ncbi:hypothetical protein IWW34DRAFT_835244 [Fusarium oxysporum f. sp. albedinis]|nr:hypothetical protein IWW34DRAFT_835244 [Fusarium oxysporum f. sp. albedinis]